MRKGQFLAFFFMCGLLGCALPLSEAPEITDSEIRKEERIQKEMALEAIEKEEARVLRVAYPILKANVELCPRVGYFSGLSLWSRYHFKKESRPFAQRALSVDEYVRVRHVYKESFADKAGIQAGDILLKLNGKIIVKGRKGDETFKNALKNYQGDSITALFQRGDGSYEAHLPLEPICQYRIEYEPESLEVNASADGRKIYITRGIQRFAKTDEELALIIGHELAHNVMRHNQKIKDNKTLAELVGLSVDIASNIYAGDLSHMSKAGPFQKWSGLWGGQYNSVEFEQEADYIGLYMLERAGFDTKQAPHFWRRIAVEYKDSSLKNQGRLAHPTSVQRFILLDKTREEIEKKKIIGQPLMPDLKKEKKSWAFLSNESN